MNPNAIPCTDLARSVQVPARTTQFRTGIFISLFFRLDNAIPLRTKTDLYGQRLSVPECHISLKEHISRPGWCLQQFLQCLRRVFSCYSLASGSWRWSPVDVCSSFFRSWISFSSLFQIKIQCLRRVFHVTVWPVGVGDGHQLMTAAVSLTFHGKF